MRHAILISFAFVLFSCSKKSQTKDDTALNQSILTGNTWKLTASVSDAPYDWDGNGTTETNIYATKTDCKKEYRYRFDTTAKGTFRYDCNAAGKSFGWQPH